MKTIQRLVSWPAVLTIAGISLMLALLIAPAELLAGDIDSVGGYRFKIYEEAPPGDGPSGVAPQGGEGATQVRSGAGATSGHYPFINDKRSTERVHITLLMRWLQFVTFRR